MKLKALAFFVLMILLQVSNTNAIDLIVNYTQLEIEILPGENMVFGQFNISKLNFTSNESIAWNIATMITTVIPYGPFIFTTDRTDFYDFTILNLSVNVTEFFPYGNYSNNILLVYGNNSINQNYIISVLPEFTWGLVESNYNIDVNVSEKKSLQINVFNKGNIEIFTNSSILGECLNYSAISATKTLYPNIDNNYLMSFDIPSDKQTNTSSCIVTITNINNFSQSYKANITINIIDNIKPIVIKTIFPNVMAFNDNIFMIEASDNAKIANVTGELLYMNHSVWFVNETRYTEDKNVSISTFTFVMETPNKWTYVLTDTSKIGQYYVRYKVEDMNDNFVEDLGYFNINYLDVIHYNKTYDIGFLEKNYESSTPFLTVNFQVPIVITIADIKFLEDIKEIEYKNTSYIIGIQDFDGNTRYFKNGETNMSFEGTGELRLLFSSNVVGRAIGKFSITSVEQHIPIEDITFSLQIIDYKPPYVHYENNPVPGVNHVCDLDNTGNLATSVQTCISTIRYPYFLSDSNIPIIKNLKEIEAERTIWQDALDTERQKNESLQITIYIISILFIASLVYIFYIKRIRPFIFVLGG